MKKCTKLTWNLNYHGYMKCKRQKSFGLILVGSNNKLKQQQNKIPAVVCLNLASGQLQKWLLHHFSYKRPQKLFIALSINRHNTTEIVLSQITVITPVQFYIDYPESYLTLRQDYWFYLLLLLLVDGGRPNPWGVCSLDA